MHEVQARNQFVNALRRVISHLIDNACTWYEQLMPWLSAADRGDWARLEDEMKLVHLDELVALFYRREGLGEFFEASDRLDRALFAELESACKAYRNALRRRT